MAPSRLAPRRGSIQPASRDAEIADVFDVIASDIDNLTIGVDQA
jgi:hypothetical protein